MAVIDEGERAMKFIVVLHTDDGHQYGATVPNLPGCFSSGADLGDALGSVHEAIDLHVETQLQDGAPVPATSTLTAHQANPQFAGGVGTMVDVPVEKYLGPANKVNITVPRLVLQRIDEYAKRHGQSRSGFMVRAAEAAMQG
jgi:predicted RNase H-like HicB family nuclease